MEPLPRRVVDPVRDHGGDVGHGLLNRDAVGLLPVAEAEGDGAGLNVLSPGDQGEGDLVLGGVADLLAEAVIGVWTTPKRSSEWSTSTRTPSARSRAATPST